jgi:ketosteroid isomerase-like protein
MKKICSLSYIFFLVCAIGFSVTSDINNDVLEVLIKQKAAWNQGDIDGFMDYYWKSEELIFQSGNNRVIGWDALIARYKANYSGENMGTLYFTDIVINVVSEDFVLVLGHWEVKAKDESSGGLFTLVLQHKPEGWRIIHDHTSS